MEFILGGAVWLRLLSDGDVCCWQILLQKSAIRGRGSPTRSLGEVAFGASRPTTWNEFLRLPLSDIGLTALEPAEFRHRISRGALMYF
jgi:hypothetical protein